MKRLHVHIAVNDLDRSVDFYSTLFGAAPNVLKQDYAKWMLDDPRVNFAVSRRGSETGVNHLGIQVESDSELHEMAERLETAGEPVLKQDRASCCYVLSDKAWVKDPQGIAWETFHTMGEIAIFGEDTFSGRDRASGRGDVSSDNDAAADDEPGRSTCCDGSRAP